MRAQFADLGSLIKAGLYRTGVQGAVKEKMALALWPEVVGKKTASVTRVERINQGTLFVTCRDSMWAQELHFLVPVIRKKINEKLGSNVIKEIRVSGRGFRKGESGETMAEQPVERKKKMPNLSKQEVETIESAAMEKIEDPDLAAKVVKALEAARKLRKSLE